MKGGHPRPAPGVQTESFHFLCSCKLHEHIYSPVATMRESEKYGDFIREIDDHRTIDSPSLSVILVTYRRPKELSACLDSLRSQTYRDFEVIIVHNGGSVFDDEWQSGLSAVCLHLTTNHRQVLGRNIGSEFARGELLYFLDDDSIVAPYSLQNLVEFFQTHSAVAVRGRFLPRTESLLNTLASHYDLGDVIVEGKWHENNAAVRLEVFREVGGYDDGFPIGHEATFLFYCLVKKWGAGRVVYLPGTVVYHDYAPSVLHYFKKKARHGMSRAIQERRYPEIVPYIKNLATIENRGQRHPRTRALSFSGRLLRGIIARVGTGCYALGYSYGKRLRS